MAIDEFWLATFAGFIAIYTALRVMGPFKRKNLFPVDGRTVLITGGSQGMGKALGQLLASKGANIILVARDVPKLEAALSDIQSSAINPSTQRFHYISADLTSPTESPRIMTEATIWNNSTPPPIIFCCAGSSHPGYFLDLDPSLLKSQMDTNYFSAAYLAHAACRSWLSSRPPNPTTQSKTPNPPETNHIIFTSSVLSFLPLAGYTPYTPAKSALRALSETLSQELLLYAHKTPIRTHTIYPAGIESPGYEQENLLKPGVTKKMEESDVPQSAEVVARRTLKGLERGEESVVTGFFPGRVLRSGMLGGTRRGGAGLGGGWLDTMIGWVVGLVLPGVRWEFDRTVRKWGREKGTGGVEGGKG